MIKLAGKSFLFSAWFPSSLFHVIVILWSVVHWSLQIEMHAPHHGTALESGSGALLFHWRSLRSRICSLDAPDGLFVWARISPHAAQGWRQVYAICMKLLDNGGRKWSVVHLEYKCSGRVSAGRGPLSRLPGAVWGVCWWPADYAKCCQWFSIVNEIMSVGSV